MQTRPTKLRVAIRNVLLGASASSFVLMTNGVYAQDAENSSRSATDILVEEVIVTGTKRADGEKLQSAPVAVTAISGAAIDALFVQDIEDLSYNIPNVQLEDIGTIPGTANFSIRGVAVNSSIPSIDPAVALVYDDVPLAINTGVIFDTFDLEAVEVLRGPQGTLFGRNATGGAVVMRTSDPTDEFVLKSKLSYETDLVRSATVISGPISDTFSAKLGVLYEDDDGYFDNKAPILTTLGRTDLIVDGLNSQKSIVYRPAIKWTPTDNFTLTAKYEHGEIDGVGGASQNRGLNGDIFDTGVDGAGPITSEWSQFTGKVEWDVGFGDGTITNIISSREYDSTSAGDIDSSPLFVFHSFSRVGHEQFSNELRYSGRFGNTGLTAGIFYMDQDLSYIEDREIPSVPLPFIGGGEQDVKTLGIFAEADIDINDTTTLIVGGRFSDEEKDGQIERIFASNDCTRTECTNYDVALNTDFNKFTPRLGVRYQPSDSLQTYLTYTAGVRSGGFNFRNTSPVAPIVPFDFEEAKSIELGAKKTFANKVRLNGALFHTTLDNLQREVNRADPVAGVVQEITNTADATIQGFELELLAPLTDNLILTSQLGITSGEYDRVLFDISGDGVVDEADLALELPRLAPRTYGVGLIYDYDFANNGTLTLQGNYNYRASAKYTDNNLGVFPEFNALDASIAYRTPNDQWKVALYGRNLLDEISFGNDTQLPPNFPGSVGFPIPPLAGTGATFSPLKKGRVIGLELEYKY